MNGSYQPELSLSVPAQDVTAGTVRIAVVEGRLGEIKLDKGEKLRADADQVRLIVSSHPTVGQPLSAEGLERSLLLANDLAGIRATGVLEAGESRLRLKVEDTAFVTGDLTINNQGVKATGTWQLAGGVALNNLSGRGDRLSLRGLAAQDLSSAQLRYTLPLGANGTQLGLKASELRYRLGDRFVALDAKGNATTLGADLGHPMLRGQNANLVINGGIESRRTADDSLGAATRRHDIDAVTLRVSGDSLDGWQGGGLSQYAIPLTTGDLDISRVAADLAADAAGPRSQGSYTKLGGQFTRLQRLPADFTLRAGLSAQWAGKNLDSSEKFVLGGAYGIRAYPVNEAASDAGWLLNLELRRDIGQGWQALGFIDAGGIRLHQDTWTGWQGGGTTPNSYELYGAGVGLVWNRPGEWNFSLTLAAPLGSNPGRDASGNNNDGSGQRSSRAWAQLSKLF
ncbi:MAG: ShlB/FhaC/HecB family hemolysin secretion/activation protein [Sulfuritalea sp.]|nr:ShlB/FhaC/HecB family hemolysin secretion/activation protein [Sulfuritalea sp.]